ncbi:hypothetical protein SacRon12I_04510 [Sulfolobus acidocaldarius Ron12/I]|uniref:Pterin-binding domain-containing protein n=1 Tax=Sulfolobus acidocaldarius Ron12/I TaxID=1028567 RepID=M1J1L3_9CREN|nr:hypothetical protein SacRon12I_04510 [Sulfolobus acidocaldarius Ron12/I]
MITAKLAYNNVKAVSSSLGVDTDILMLNYPIASLMTVDYIVENLKSLKLGKYDYIIIPGLVNGDAKKIEEVTGIKTYKGTEDINDLPLMIQALKNGLSFSTTIPADKLISIEREKEVSLELRRLEENGDYAFEVNGLKIPRRPPPFRIFLEIDGTKSLELLENEIERVDKLVDVIVIGFPSGHEDISEVKNKVSKLSSMKLTAIDSGSPKELIEGVKAGASFVFNLNEENISDLLDIKRDAVFIVAPFSVENKATTTLKIRDKAKQLGFDKLILDPILSPPITGLVESLCEYKTVRENSNEPMLMGLLNVTELIDADSVGINGILTSIAGELGVANLLTMERGKTRGSSYEINTATKMISIALNKRKNPKDLGLDLLILKDKKKISTSLNENSGEIIRVYEYLEPKNMDKGYVKIDKNDEEIVLTYYGKEKFSVVGTSGLSIGRKFIEKANVNTEHALYIGYELAKAEIALNLGKNYIQDKPLFKHAYINAYSNKKKH